MATGVLIRLSALQGEEENVEGGGKETVFGGPAQCLVAAKLSA